MIIKVYDVSEEVTSNLIDDNQKENILNIFDTLTEETQLITNCFLDLRSIGYEESPIYYLNEDNNRDNFDYKKIADDLLKAECKEDGTRNVTIRKGLLFIKAHGLNITIMKLEKLDVIDIDTYEIKSELGKEKDYFKVCSFSGNYGDIKIIDKNRTAAKYWYQKFLGLERIKTSEDSTADVIQLISDKNLYKEEIVDRDNYEEIERFTEFYLFDNRRFDKSDLFNKLNSSGLIQLRREDELFSEKSESVDSDFDISVKAINNIYSRKIKVSDEITIITKNYLESIRDSQLIFEENYKKITITIEDEYLNKVKEKLDSE